MQIRYETRDGEGNDIEKLVEIKEYPTVEIDSECPICHKQKQSFVKLKHIVSANFTDFAYVGDLICSECAGLFSLYFYSYIVDPDGIRLMNVRQIRDEICQKQKAPFRFIITKTQKKHLFYKSIINNCSDYFAVNLEEEVIFTTIERMKVLFEFVECLLTLGASKKAMLDGEIPLSIIEKTGSTDVLVLLQKELTSSREIQIPLFCGQKREITEEEAICLITSILMTSSELTQL